MRQDPGVRGHQIRARATVWRRGCFRVVAGAATTGVLAGLVVPSLPVHAQAPAEAPRRFEVVSVKPRAARDGMFNSRFLPGGRFTATGTSVQMLITTAYDLQPYQLDGQPDWLETERFDIVAKATGDASRDDMLPMLQALLAERFGLRVHHETRQLPTFALVLARSDGRLGPGLVPSSVDCKALADARKRGDAPPPQPLSADERPHCGASVMLSPAGFKATFGSTTMTGMADLLGSVMGGLVTDQTGLTGAYDVDLTFSSDGLSGPFASFRPPSSASPLPGAASATQGPAGIAPPAPAESQVPSLRNALQEQLGLKIESQRGPVDVLVIDHVERPKEN